MDEIQTIFLGQDKGQVIFQKFYVLLELKLGSDIIWHKIGIVNLQPKKLEYWKTNQVYALICYRFVKVLQC